MTFAEAIASRTLRVNWSVPAERCPEDTAQRLFVLARTRQPRLPGPSQDELLHITAVEAAEGGARVHFEWVFDRDFHSQYDATETWRGVALLRSGADELERWS